MRTRPALTLVELILVMGLIAVLTVPFVISFSGFRQRHALKVSGENFANTVRTARVYAREERQEQSWGLRYIGVKAYSVVTGSPTSFTIYRNYELDSTVNFADSFPDIWFGQSNGETDRNYQVDFVTTSGLLAKVEISKAGIVKYVGP